MCCPKSLSSEASSTAGAAHGVLFPALSAEVQMLLKCFQTEESRLLKATSGFFPPALPEQKINLLRPRAYQSDRGNEKSKQRKHEAEL